MLLENNSDTDRTGCKTDESLLLEILNIKQSQIFGH